MGGCAGEVVGVGGEWVGGRGEVRVRQGQHDNGNRSRCLLTRTGDCRQVRTHVLVMWGRDEAPRSVASGCMESARAGGGEA